MKPTPRWRARLTAAALLAAPLCAVALPAPAQAHTVINAPDFQQVSLARGTAEMGEPISMAVLPDRSVLHTSRDGTLRLTTAAGATKVSGRLNVYTHDEEGMQGVGIDPNFTTNRFIYLYYAPLLSTPAGDAPLSGTDFSVWQGYNRLSRFVLRTDGTLDLASEKKVLDVGTDRGNCCHVGGDIDFDAAGNLYLSTGDDSNPFYSDGYAPLDERGDSNPVLDSQRSAGNTNDLRGKVLRIKVNADASYSIPAGNLFAPGTARTRPEIYAMGFRNPYRMTVDKATGIVYLGDYGPDAGSTSSARGPAGQVEFDRIPSAGNYGWPYCTGTNTTTETYNEWNFATNSTGPKYNCAAPVNNSPHNTGLTNLPPARPSWIRYGGDAGSPPEFGSGSESPMGGALYRYDAANPSATKFPADLDGHFFAAEFGRRWLRAIDVNTDGSAGSITNFPWSGTQIIDTAFGPDGALYVLDYGTGWGNGDANSALYRIEYIGATANRAPIAVASADKTSGTGPLAVTFSSAGSSDPEGGALTYSWAFGDGGTSTAASPAHTYTANGQYTATLTVRDPVGNTGTASVIITVGNTAPTVTLSLPGDGQLFSFGDTVPFQISVTDPEDGAIDCSKVTLTYLLGHDTHAHQITSTTGCTGSIVVPADGEHDASANVYGVFDAQYTDKGALTTHTQHVLQPRHRQAEHFATSSGVTKYLKTAAEGGATVGDVNNGDWIGFTTYQLGNAKSFDARVSSGGSGGTLTLRTGSPTGPAIGSATVPVTGGWETFTTVTGTITAPPAATTSLYLVFTGSGSGFLYDVDAFTLNTSGTTPPPGVGPIRGVGAKCVDVAGGATADGTKIQLNTCNGSTAQSWTTGGSTLKALGKCMNVAGTANSTNVQLWTCNGSAGQTWTPQSDGSLKNPSSGRCLDAFGGSSADGTQLIIWDCHGGTNQKWTLP
ncbi:glucose/arabinose dehydrogenase [Longispora fulva]|uniref:Glucose/arabinose dehydrogenase n=1 Tax=Longispora fulva TaxID=619741 RepID=A0A8J7GCX1_9ACTN|nr:glucose/arabinose dehydrogenase [Longispora fulva]